MRVCRSVSRPLAVMAVVLTVLNLLLPVAPALAQAQDARSLLLQAKTAFRNLEFQLVIETLDRVLKESSDPEILVEAHLYRGMCLINLGSMPAAEDEFRKVLDLQPGKRLEPEMFPPKFVAPFERIVQERLAALPVTVREPAVVLGPPAAVAAAGAAARAADAPAKPAPVRAAGAAAGAKPWYKKIWVWGVIGGAVLVIGAVAAASGGGGDDNSPQSGALSLWHDPDTARKIPDEGCSSGWRWPTDIWLTENLGGTVTLETVRADSYSPSNALVYAYEGYSVVDFFGTNTLQPRQEIRAQIGGYCFFDSQQINGHIDLIVTGRDARGAEISVSATFLPLESQ
ncbi:MAG: tetratricopeptide repeat protein [Candidatus Schekmanbacteria bacterium]|nr:tetratricopeptide repeat protein [Candidatus Schekmanbacteria bacterium]